MPYIFKHRRPPEPWREFRNKSPHAALRPLFFFNWMGEWAVYACSHWSFFEVLEYVGSLSILLAVVFYFADAPDRRKQKHYQAWQVINTAQGKGGSGGRMDALQELNEDGVPLVGADVAGAYLQDVRLPDADLRRADLRAADARRAALRHANLEGATLRSANLRGADLTHARLVDASLVDADLAGASLTDSSVGGADLDKADLRDADLRGLRDWRSIASVHLANVHGVRNAPEGFVQWAKEHGAVDVAEDAAWDALQRVARVEKE